MVLTNQSHSELFDLDPWVGQRSGTFRFDLIDGVTLRNLGEIHPDRGSPPTLTHDVTRTVKRTLTPVLLDAEDTARVDPVNNRVAVTMVVRGVDYPLGRYVFTDQTIIRTSSGTLSTNTLVDEMFIVDQKIERAYTPRNETFPDGTIYINQTCDQSIADLVRELPVTFTAEPTPFATVNSWPQGTNRGRIVDELALAGDYFAAWFDNQSVMRCIRAFDPATAVPDFDWDANDVVFRDSITEVSDLVQAPNRIIVVSNNPGIVSTWLPIVGTYDIPSSAPHSFLNRGFRIVDVQALSVSTQAQAQALAQNIGQRGTVFERVELTTPPDPRFDSHNVVRWQGDNWLELAWSLTLVEGGDMRHTLRKAYR